MTHSIADDRAHAYHLRIGVANAGSARMPDIGIHGLNDPALYDLRHIVELGIHLVVARRRSEIAKVDLVLIEGTHAVGKARINNARAEAVVRAVRDNGGENDAGIDLDIDLIAIGRADRGTVENRNAGVCAAPRNPIELLIDHSVKSKVAAVHDRYAAACGACQKRPVIGEALVWKLAKMTPAADLQSRGKPGVVFCAIMPPLKFADHERRILEAKTQAIAIACIGIGVAAGCRRIAVEDRKQQRGVLRQFVLYARSNGRQRISGSASRQVDRADRRPIALQENLADVAVKK